MSIKMVWEAENNVLQVGGHLYKSVFLGRGVQINMLGDRGLKKYRVASGEGEVRGKTIFKVSEKSGNLTKRQEILWLLGKSWKSLRIW